MTPESIPPLDLDWESIPEPGIPGAQSAGDQADRDAALERLRQRPAYKRWIADQLTAEAQKLRMGY